MPNEKLLHAEDVIFNKPSLKELVRLIKNGTINAIWPSTAEEFRDWNNGGYLKYAPRGQKLKSQKTAMTVYYGDHQDSASTGEINKEKTQENFNQIINAINAQKEEITDLKYYDDKKDIYPSSNNNLTLSLNDSTGQINNAQNVINYKTIILEQYQKNIDKINEFINRIKQFNPIVDTVSLTLSDQDIINDYKEFFINSTNEINENFRNTIALPEWDKNGEDVKNILIDSSTNIYDFSKINVLYDRIELAIQQIKNLIESFYNSESFVFDDQYRSKLYQLSLEYQLMQSQLENSINSFYLDWRKEVFSSQQLYRIIQIPQIFIIDISLEKQQEYLENIDLLYSKYITPYENLIKKTYILKNLGAKTLSEADEYYKEWFNNVKTAENNYSDFESKANIINDFITPINSDIFNIMLYDNEEAQTIIKIYFEQNGIKDYSIIKQQLENNYNILETLEDILSEYDKKLLPSNYLPRTPINLTNFNEQLEKIYNNFDILLKLDENGESKIQKDQANIITLYNQYQTEYYNFLNRLKNLNITSVAIEEKFLLTENGISNFDDIQKTITDQVNKMLLHYEVLQDVLGNYLAESIKNLNNEAQSISSRITNATIESTETGKEEAFIDQVINPNKDSTEDDYTLSAINLLLKRITNNTLSFTEEQIIPKISEDFLTIYNKDVVITNLYSILNKGESLNRKYILEHKIDNINSLLQGWGPVYTAEVYSHYTCIAVGSDIKFGNEIQNSNLTQPLPNANIDGSITIIVDEEYHYPLINNMADIITENTRKGQVLTVGGLISLFSGGDPNANILNQSVGNHYEPIHISKGKFTKCNNVISGNYETTQKGGTTYWNVVRYNGSSASSVGLQALKLFGAVYNDYAEYRSAEAHPGRCIIENGNGTLSLSSGRLQLGANIVSDTYGFAIGETNEATCPVAVCGRVLAYPLESKELYTPGAAVCSGPDGTISLMTREEIREWPDAIIGYVSEVPTYDTWGSDNVPVNGRVWMKIK